MGNLSDVSLASYAGKKKVLSIVPSLGTGVCAASTKVFNERASALPDTVVLVISADLPFAQKRFCADVAIDGVVPLSLMRGRGFAKEYGVMITSGPFEGVISRDRTGAGLRRGAGGARLARRLLGEPR